MTIYLSQHNPVYLIVALTLVSCAPLLVGPENSDSSLIIGRVVVNNQFYDELGLLPLGVIDKGVQVSIESCDGKQITTTTESGGYFLIPNAPCAFGHSGSAMIPQFELIVFVTTRTGFAGWLQSFNTEQ